MKKVYSVKDIDDLHRSSALGSIPADAVITPTAVSYTHLPLPTKA